MYAEGATYRKAHRYAVERIEHLITDRVCTRKDELNLNMVSYDWHNEDAPHVSRT